jgi:hypothetical protein
MRGCVLSDTAVLRPHTLPCCCCLQSFEPPEPVEGDGSRWVIGWQFAAGEYLQVSRDVFGDEGIQQVFMSPSAQGPAESAEEVPGLPPSRGTLGQTPQRVAVFSECHC